MGSVQGDGAATGRGVQDPQKFSESWKSERGEGKPGLCGPSPWALLGARVGSELVLPLAPLLPRIFASSRGKMPGIRDVCLRLYLIHSGGVEMLRQFIMHIKINSHFHPVGPFIYTSVVGFVA